MIFEYSSFGLGYNFNFLLLQCVLHRFSDPLSLEGSLHYIAPFRWSLSYICWSSRPLLECLSIKHLPKPLVSWGSQGSIVQESSPHKWSQEVWWDALNVVATTIPLVMSGLTPSPKIFLYSMTSSGNVLLTWPYCSSVWPPWHDNGPLDHGYDTWRKYLT